MTNQICGIAGIAKVMESLGANLNAQVLCLQYNYEDPPATVAGLAKTLTIVSNYVFTRNTMNSVYEQKELIFGNDSCFRLNCPTLWVIVYRVFGFVRSNWKLLGYFKNR